MINELSLFCHVISKELIDKQTPTISYDYQRVSGHKPLPDKTRQEIWSQKNE